MRPFPLLFVLSDVFFFSAPGVFSAPKCCREQEKSVCRGLAREHPLLNQKSACKPRCPTPLHAHIKQPSPCAFSFSYVSLQCEVSPLAPKPSSAHFWSFQPIFGAAVPSLPSTYYTVASNQHPKIPSAVPHQGNIWQAFCLWHLPLPSQLKGWAHDPGLLHVTSSSLTGQSCPASPSRANPDFPQGSAESMRKMTFASFWNHLSLMIHSLKIIDLRTTENKEISWWREEWKKGGLEGRKRRGKSDGFSVTYNQKRPDEHFLVLE